MIVALAGENPMANGELLHGTACEEVGKVQVHGSCLFRTRRSLLGAVLGPSIWTGRGGENRASQKNRDRDSAGATFLHFFLERLTVFRDRGIIKGV